MDLFKSHESVQRQISSLIITFYVGFPGHQLSVFNSQAQIQVGGKWNRAKQKVERPFVGVMAGLVLNGLRLLDLAAEQVILRGSC